MCQAVKVNFMGAAVNGLGIYKFNISEKTSGQGDTDFIVFNLEPEFWIFIEFQTQL
jgi:hypothetical protein